MTAQEFTDWRKYNNLTQDDAAERLGISRRSVQYYEAGDLPIPKVVALACREIERGGNG